MSLCRLSQLGSNLWRGINKNFFHPNYQSPTRSANNFYLWRNFSEIHSNTSNYNKQQVRYHSNNKDEKDLGPPVTIHFIDKDGTRTTVTEPAGLNILEVAHKNKIDLEGNNSSIFTGLLTYSLSIGACGGSCACSTCHVVVVDKNLYDQLPEPSDEENDMLDLAFGLTETSRLGCQVVLKPELEGMELKLPSATRNLYVDGHKPPKH